MAEVLMGRTRSRWCLLLLVLLALHSRPVAAISPSLVMFYGGSLKEPLVVRLDHTISSEFLWDSRFRKWAPEPGGKLAIRDLAPRLADRPFLSVAIFWGQKYKPGLTPAEASQHGRLYAATASQPAVMVATVPDMQAVSHPIPGGLDGFYAGWPLTPEDLANARTLGIPGFD
jgi:hypothetical protein